MHFLGLADMPRRIFAVWSVRSRQGEDSYDVHFVSERSDRSPLLSVSKTDTSFVDLQIHQPVRLEKPRASPWSYGEQRLLGQHPSDHIA
jgi:hypothetical protein